MTYTHLEDAVEALPALLEIEAVAKHQVTQGEVVLEAAEAEYALSQREKLTKYTEPQIKELVANDHKIYSLRLELARRQLEYDRAKNSTKICWKTIEIFQHLSTPR